MAMSNYGTLGMLEGSQKQSSTTPFDLTNKRVSSVSERIRTLTSTLHNIMDSFSGPVPTPQSATSTLSSLPPQTTVEYLTHLEESLAMLEEAVRRFEK